MKPRLIPTTSKPKSKIELEKYFANPPALYRAKPFWAWNGKLEEHELRRQIRIMHQMGLGGFFMHSRIGLATPYLSDAWHKMVAACVDEAARLKMEAWLYDEDLWPSGFGGGLVTRHVKYRARCVLAEALHHPCELRKHKDWLAVFIAAWRNDTTLAYARPYHTGQKIGSNEFLLAFRMVIEQNSDRFNGYTYLDTLNPAAVREFIRVTHQAYARRFQRFFGKTIPGIFTDEPYAGTMLPRPPSPTRIPWTDKFPQIFQRRYGYDITAHLPAIFYDIADHPHPRARYHYHQCLSQLFTESFCKQIGAWCARHKLALTGHMLGEDTLSYQAKQGDCMPAYEYFQIPGMDLLTERRRNFITAKQVSSAARQFGQKWRLTETYGVTGWDFSFEGHKALGDWQAALGINLRCQHLSWYTMVGRAKRDYPASILHQSPWWPAYRYVEDYFARINLIMTQGAEIRDLLVIHPIDSAQLFLHLHSNETGLLSTLDRDFDRLTEFLLRHQLDFDYGHESILAHYGKLQISKNSARLKVGCATYSVVLVPHVITMRRTTLSLLEKFAQAGGVVVFLNQPPTHLDGQPSDIPAQFAKKCQQAADINTALIRLLEPSCRRIQIMDDAGRPVHAALYLLRADKNAYYLFVHNTSHTLTQRQRAWNEEVRVCERRAAWPRIQIHGFQDCAGQPQLWNPENGKVYAADAKRSGNGWTIYAPFHRLASHIFIIPRQPQRKILPPLPQPNRTHTRLLSVGRRPILLSEPNVLVLDRPAYRINNSIWHKPEEILRIDSAVRQHLGLPRALNMPQPWTQLYADTKKSCSVELQYAIQVKHLPQNTVWLALESPEHFSIYFNGHSVAATNDHGWWCDPSLRLLPLDPAWFHQGENALHLRLARYQPYSALEICYLLGNFGIAIRGIEPVIIAPPTTLRLGDWTKQGLPFYSGNLTYLWQNLHLPKQRRVHVFLRIKNFRGTAIQAYINGKAVGIIAWPPYELDITDFLPEQSFTLGIEILGHRRNSHGPLHLTEKWPEYLSPHLFYIKDNRWQDGYNLVPCGLMAPPEIVIKHT